MKLGFYSTMIGMPWGGSEVLWSKVALRLLERGWQVTANVKWWHKEATPLAELRAAGATVWKRQRPNILNWLTQSPIQLPGSELRFARHWITRERPDFVLLSVGNHLDPLLAASELLERDIPYAINVQAAGPQFIDDLLLDEFRQAYKHAEAVYFVSAENQVQVETNLALQLNNASIIDNPFNVAHDADPAWPEDSSRLRLACVARLHFHSKSQDLLIRVLRKDKWRRRNLSVSLVGEAQGNVRQMRDLIALYDMQQQLQLIGHLESTEEIWANHHALILPSRYEGAALSIVEALLCNRICITTDVGRNSELIDHGQTGFVAAAATEQLLDRALEEAWQKREHWQSMGKLAGERIRERYSLDPVQDFLAELLSLSNSLVRHGGS